MTQAFMSTAPIMEGEVPQKGGKAVEGTFSGTIWDRSDDSPKSQKFKAAYDQAVRIYPGEFTKLPDYYPVNAYDAVFMIVEAIKKKGVTNKPADLAKDRAKIMEYLTTLRNFDGVASRGFNEVGDGVKDVQVYEIKGGQWVLVKD
jgi:ABC-type branched-subunit amino acid transport system substrate-binding protein